jgi:L-rhamnose-H+ transport protein
MSANPFLGAALHSIGAFSASSCYTPQKQTKKWSWEIYWITQASCAWLIIPILGAFLTIPNYMEVLASCPKDAMLRSFLLGMLYGFGGLTFGLGFDISASRSITRLPLESRRAWNSHSADLESNTGLDWVLYEKFSDTRE